MVLWKPIFVLESSKKCGQVSPINRLRNHLKVLYCGKET